MSTSHIKSSPVSRVTRAATRSFTTFLFSLLAPAIASACPLCHTATGDKVRAAIFGTDFWFNVSVTVVPFAIFLGLTALLYFGLPTLKTGSSSIRFTQERGEQGRTRK
jgi:arginine exporter protein ArgO